METYSRLRAYLTDIGAAGGTRSGRQDRRVHQSFIDEHERILREFGNRDILTGGQARNYADHEVTGGPRHFLNTPTGINLSGVPDDFRQQIEEERQEVLNADPTGLAHFALNEDSRGPHFNTGEEPSDPNVNSFTQFVRNTRRFSTFRRNRNDRTYGVADPRTSSPSHNLYASIGDELSEGEVDPLEDELDQNYARYSQYLRQRHHSVPNVIRLIPVAAGVGLTSADGSAPGRYERLISVSDSLGDYEHPIGRSLSDNALSEVTTDWSEFSHHSSLAARSELIYDRERADLGGFEVPFPFQQLGEELCNRIEQRIREGRWPDHRNPLFHHSINQQCLFQNQEHHYDVPNINNEFGEIDNIMTNMQPPIFDPGNATGAVQDPYSFLDFYYRWCKCQTGNWNDTKCIETVPMFLRGGALFFYNNYEREKRDVDGAWAALTWEQFKTDFIAAFPSTSSPYQLANQLKERKMVPTESMEAYYYSILELINRVDPEMVESRKITTIISGLPEHIVQSMSMSLPTTLTDLKTKILSVSQHSVGQNRAAQLYANVSPVVPATTTGGLPPAVSITNTTSTSDLQNVINAALKSQKKIEKKLEERDQKQSGELSVKQMASQLGQLGLKIIPKESKQDFDNPNFRKGNVNRFRGNRKRGGWDNRRGSYSQQQQQSPYYGHVNAVAEIPYGYSVPANYSYPNQPVQMSPQQSQYANQGSGYYNEESAQNVENQGYTRGGPRGRGQRGNRGYNNQTRGRGTQRGRGSYKAQGEFSSGRDAEGNPVCFNCGKKGHISRDCKKPRSGAQGKN